MILRAKVKNAKFSVLNELFAMHHFLTSMIIIDSLCKMGCSGIKIVKKGDLVEHQVFRVNEEIIILFTYLVTFYYIMFSFVPEM